MSERRMELSMAKLVFSLLYLVNSFLLLEGFQWSFRQQANHVIDVEVGSDISLPCEYELNPQELREANTFFLLTWTREEPVNSDKWAGLAVNSTVTGNKVIYEDPQRIFITQGSLAVRNVTVQDRTRYQCAFQSSFFTTPSIIELNVLFAPEITVMPSSQEVIEGNGVSLHCNASGNPYPTITWTKQGSNAVLSMSEILSLTDLISEDDGAVYTCSVQNYLGSQQANATITMLYKPKSTRLTTLSSEVRQGERLDITCSARANPSPEYKFYHDDKLIRWSSKGVLSINSFKTENQGTYRCVPINNIGDGPQASVTVTLVRTETFPLWAYGAISGGALFIILIATVIAVCWIRRKKKKPDGRAKAPQPKNSKIRPRDAKGSHVGPGAFYGDFVNAQTEIPHLNGAVSFSDIRISREFPSLKSSFSTNDVRTDEMPSVKGALNDNNVRMGETAFSRLEEAYPTQSVIHLITGVEEAVSQL